MSYTEKDLEKMLSNPAVRVAKNSASNAIDLVPDHFVEMHDMVKPSKYRNQKVQADGDTFDSKGELARWRQLQMLERAGKITKLRRQVTFELAPGVILDGRKRPPLRFTADFEYYAGFWHVVEDFKNPATAAETAFKIRRHLMMAIHGIEVKIITKEG